jgi:hypothetical protein
MIFIALSGRKKMSQSIFIFSIIIIFAFSIPNFIYSDILRSISEHFDKDSETYYKLNDMSDFILYGESSKNGTSERMTRFPELLDAFIANPIFGNASNINGINIDSGAHLYWMNRLAVWGLFGFIFVAIIHYKYITKTLKLFDSGFKFIYLLSIGSIILYGIFKNLGGRDSWFAYFLIVPGLYYLPLLKKEKKVEEPLNIE